jgi:hypothetical protein
MNGSCSSRWTPENSDDSTRVVIRGLIYRIATVSASGANPLGRVYMLLRGAQRPELFNAPLEWTLLAEMVDAMGKAYCAEINENFLTNTRYLILRYINTMVQPVVDDLMKEQRRKADASKEAMRLCQNTMALVVKGPRPPSINLDGQLVQKTCLKCNVLQGRNGFSNRQWRAGRNRKMRNGHICKNCVTIRGIDNNLVGNRHRWAIPEPGMVDVRGKAAPQAVKNAIANPTSDEVSDGAVAASVTTPQDPVSIAVENVKHTDRELSLVLQHQDLNELHNLMLRRLFKRPLDATTLGAVRIVLMYAGFTPQNVHEAASALLQQWNEDRWEAERNVLRMLFPTHEVEQLQ